MKLARSIAHRSAQSSEPRCHLNARSGMNEFSFWKEIQLSGMIRAKSWAPLTNQRRVSAPCLFCAVGAIAGISQTWDNEPSPIESIVDGRSPKTNIGMQPTHPLHSLLSGNQTDKTDVLCSAFLDTINGGSGCITGCQHRRHDDDEPL